MFGFKNIILLSFFCLYSAFVSAKIKNLSGKLQDDQVVWNEVDIKQIELEYLESRKPIVFMIHGFKDNDDPHYLVFNQLLMHFNNNYTAIAFDIELSDSLEEVKEHTESLAKSIQSFYFDHIEYLEVEKNPPKLDLIGYSTGGISAYLASFSESVSFNQLVLIGAPLFGLPTNLAKYVPNYFSSQFCPMLASLNQNFTADKKALEIPTLYVEGLVQKETKILPFLVHKMVYGLRLNDGLIALASSETIKALSNKLVQIRCHLYDHCQMIHQPELAKEVSKFLGVAI